MNTVGRRMPVEKSVRDKLVKYPGLLISGTTVPSATRRRIWQERSLIAPTRRERAAVIAGSVLPSSAASATAFELGRQRGQRVNTRGRKESIRKALYERQRRTNLAHATEAAAGSALLAWGAPRVMSRTLARGVKDAARATGSKETLEAIQRSQAMAGVLNSTGQAAARARSIKAVSDAVDLVPQSIRPQVATTAGALLLYQAHPVRTTRYKPVPISGSRIEARF